MLVEVLAGAVVSHGGSRVCVARRDLDVPQADAGVEHGGHESMPEHVRVHPRHADARRVGQLPESTRGDVPVHPSAVDIAEDRSGVAAVSGSVDRAGDRRREWDQHCLVSLAADLQHAVAVFLAEVADARSAGLEDPQAEETKHGDQGEVVDVRRQAGSADQRFELQMSQAKRW